MKPTQVWSSSQPLMADLLHLPLLQSRDRIQAVHGWLFVVAFTPHLLSALLLISRALIYSRSKSIYGLLSPIQQSALQCEASAWCTHAVGKAVRQEWLCSAVVPLSSRPHYVCDWDLTSLYWGTPDTAAYLWEYMHASPGGLGTPSKMEANAPANGTLLNGEETGFWL